MRSLGSPPGSDTSSSPCPDGAARGSGGGVSPGLSCTAGSAAIASEGVVPAGFEFEFRLFTLDKFQPKKVTLLIILYASLHQGWLRSNRIGESA